MSVSGKVKVREREREGKRERDGHKGGHQIIIRGNERVREGIFTHTHTQAHPPTHT